MVKLSIRKAFHRTKLLLITHNLDKMEGSNAFRLARLIAGCLPRADKLLWRLWTAAIASGIW